VESVGYVRVVAVVIHCPLVIRAGPNGVSCASAAATTTYSTRRRYSCSRLLKRSHQIGKALGKRVVNAHKSVVLLACGLKLLLNDADLVAGGLFGRERCTKLRLKRIQRILSDPAHA